MTSVYCPIRPSPPFAYSSVRSLNPIFLRLLTTGPLFRQFEQTWPWWYLWERTKISLLFNKWRNLIKLFQLQCLYLYPCNFLITHYHNYNPDFLRAWNMMLLKTSWGMEKMLVTSSPESFALLHLFIKCNTGALYVYYYTVALARWTSHH